MGPARACSVRCHLEGQWGAFEGQIYKAFSTQKHVIEQDKVKQRFKYYIAGVDWGIRNPSCILTIGVTGDKKAVVVDEYYENERTTAQVTAKLRELHKGYSYRKIYIDPSALDLITQCEESKLPAEKADNHVEPGIGKVKSMFERSQILICDNCKNLIRELQAYRYDRDKENKNVTEKPLKLDDHSCDALRYGVYSFRLFKRKIRWMYNPSTAESY